MDFVMTLSDSEGDHLNSEVSDEDSAPRTKKVEQFSWDEGPTKLAPTRPPPEHSSWRIAELQKAGRERVQQQLQEEEEEEEDEDEDDEDDEDEPQDNDEEDNDDDDNDDDEAQAKSVEKPKGTPKPSDPKKQKGKKVEEKKHVEKGDGSDVLEQGPEGKSDKAKDAKEKKKPSRRIESAASAQRPTKQITFDALNLSRPLAKAIRDLNWSTPTPVQQMSIPLAMAGRDLLVNAVTGSGKTGAFVLPILERLLYRPKRVALTRVLIVTPTRELAAQIYDMTSQLSKYTDVRCCLVVGGLSVQAQQTALKQRPDIVVVTPGRMIDHLRNTQSVHMEDVEILVLDEADRLLELGFSAEVKELVKACPRGRQTMLFSATLTDDVVDLVNLSLNQPERVSADPFSSIVKELTHEFVRVRKPSNREAIVLALCRTFNKKTIIFMPSKQECHRLALIFGLMSLKGTELHGNLTQAQRLEALDRFAKGEVNFMLATDLAARGLDIRGVQTIINFSLPRVLTAYIHRVGRTARAGQSGCAVTLVTDDQRKELKEVLKRVHGAKSRQVPHQVVLKYAQLVESMEPDVARILDQEKVEKAERVANQEANKAQNLIKFEDEIYTRPAKTWFQSPKEKLVAKFSSDRIMDEAPKVREEKPVKEGKKKEKKDPLAGLPRKKRRRKQMMMEAQQESQEIRARALEGDPEAAKFVRAEKAAASAARIAKAKTRQTRQDEDDAPDGKKRKLGPVAPRYAGTLPSKDRFERSANTEPPAPPPKPNLKGHHAFKSKKRYKRR